MKHIPTFESFKINPKDETLKGKVHIKKGTSGNAWDLNIVEVSEDGKDWIVLNDEYAKSTTDNGTVWIPKEQWAEFKKLINTL